MRISDWSSDVCSSDLTNKGQYRLLRFLTEGKDNVLLLGDDDQLIFAWRGADSSYVVDFETQWPNGQVASLKTNYRNAPEVDRKSTRLNSSHYCAYRMPSSA